MEHKREVICRSSPVLQINNVEVIEMDLQATQTVVQLPGQTAEQSKNTISFLNLVADTYGTDGRILIVKSNVLKRDTYMQRRGPETGRKVCLCDEDGHKIIVGHKGIDWSSPSIYELAGDTELYYPHIFPFGRSRSITNSKEKKYDPRPTLLNSVIESAQKREKLLFSPCLVAMRSLIETRYTDSGVPYRALNNFTTNDVSYARCLWVDIDGHNLSDEQITALNEAAIQNLMEMLPDYCAETGLPMPAVVNSGRGVHLYWWFAEALPLQDQQAKVEFKALLAGVAHWAADLIMRDSVCAAAWQVDSGSTVFHYMNLPGTIHPRTRTPRYVVNSYGQDYFKVHLSTLLTAIKPYCTSKKKMAKKATNIAELPTDQIIPLAINTSVNEQVSAQMPASFARKAYATGRLGRLLAWAESRGWIIHNSHTNSGTGREVFLFICGTLLAQQGIASLEALWDINACLVLPIAECRVQNIINELAKKGENGDSAWDKYYCYSNANIAAALDMTPAEAERFGFANSGKAKGYGLPSKAIFPAKLAEIKGQTPRHFDESMAEWAARCYELTCDYFHANRTGSGHAARTRRRAAQAGYTGKPGRKKRDPEQINAEKQRCIQFKRENPTLTVRQIAELVGFCKSKTANYLRDWDRDGQ